MRRGCSLPGVGAEGLRKDPPDFVETRPDIRVEVPWGS
jgi:hypothetical protein